MSIAQSADSLKYMGPRKGTSGRKYKYHKAGNHKMLSPSALLNVIKQRGK